MPNWIEGTLKIRSKDINNIKNFLKEAVGYCCFSCPLSREEKDKCYETHYKERPCKTNENVKPFNKNVKYESCNDGDYVILKDLLYVADGPSRAFINKENETNEEYINIESPILIMRVQQAWGFDSEGWLTLAKKYNIDIRMYGIEQGMEFVQELEIVNGEITLEREIHYDDWDWQCPFPRMGG